MMEGRIEGESRKEIGREIKLDGWGKGNIGKERKC